MTMSDTANKRDHLEKQWKDIVSKLAGDFVANQHELRTDLNDFPSRERCLKCRDEVADLGKKRNNLLTICATDLEMLRSLRSEIELKFPGLKEWHTSLKAEYDALSRRRSESLETLKSYYSHYRSFLKKANSEGYWRTTVDRFEVSMIDNDYETQIDFEGLSATERAEICNAELAILEEKKNKLEKYTKQDVHFLAKLVDERRLEFPKDKDGYDEMNNGHIEILNRYNNLIALLSSYEENYRGYLAADKDSS